MSAILFAPHGDDETLFAFYTLRRYQPHVVVCLFSDSRRVYETGLAMDVAKCSWEQWDNPESAPDWGRIGHQIDHVVGRLVPGMIIGPAFEHGGHEHHNMVADLLGQRANISYLTYRRGYGRSRDGTEIMPVGDDVIFKAAALDCYSSQQARMDTAVWFGDDQREFVL